VIAIVATSTWRLAPLGTTSVARSKKRIPLGRSGTCSLSLCEGVLDACRVCQMVEEQRYFTRRRRSAGRSHRNRAANVLAYAVALFRNAIHRSRSPTCAGELRYVRLQQDAGLRQQLGGTLPLRINSSSWARSSTLNRTMYFLTAITFPTTNHRHRRLAATEIQNLPSF
jgi:hypothetical protein